MASNKVVKAEEIRKENALQALIVANNVSEAAETAGISRKTLYTYLNTDSDFLLAYRDAKREQLRAVSERMSEGATQATEYILSLISNEDAPPAIRLQASVKLLELYGKFRGYEGQINAAVLSATGNGLSFMGLSEPTSPL